MWNFIVCGLVLDIGCIVFPGGEFGALWLVCLVLFGLEIGTLDYDEKRKLGPKKY